MDNITFKFIAKVQTDYKEKFGIPRQSNIVESSEGKIIFEPEFRNIETIKGLEEFSHIWILWCFSEHFNKPWSSTVRPPRLGGNRRKGVFASRSPFRPNPIGMSCVRIKSIERDEKLGPIINVLGADILDGTPIIDIKPYIKYADCIPNATEGFAKGKPETCKEVIFLNDYENIMPLNIRSTVVDILMQDPRPAYHKDTDREYGIKYGEYNVRFKILDNTVYVVDIVTN